VHLKTYPAPWAVTVWLYYADKKLFGFIPYSKRGIIYGIISACTFLSLSWLSYCLFQEEFLEHAHLHHLSRQDTRHNFSVSFLFIINPQIFSDLVFIILSHGWKLALRISVLSRPIRSLPSYFVQVLK